MNPTGGGPDLTRAPYPMLSTPPPVEAPEAAELRGRIFTDLDRLAFALEMEAAGLLEQGREAEAGRVQEQRLDGILSNLRTEKYRLMDDLAGLEAFRFHPVNDPAGECSR